MLLRSVKESLAHLFHPRWSNNHRPRVLHPEAFVFLVLIVIGFMGVISQVSKLPGVWGDVLGFASSITPSQVVEKTNQERQAQGLPPLTLNAELSQAALAKGQDMFGNQYWAHVSPEGTPPWTFIQNAEYEYQVAGENLARDFSNTDDMIQAWMASPTHRANIVSSRYQDIGIAVIDGVLEGYETTLVVQMFGTPKTQPARVPDVAAASIDAITVSADEFTTVLETPPPTAQAADNAVLASALVQNGSFVIPPLFTPLQLTKAFFLAVILLLTSTLIYDSYIINHSNTLRIVGKNLAHIMLLSVVGFLIILFKGGIVG